MGFASFSARCLVINPLAPLACPIDGLRLAQCDGYWQCPSNHHFDLSRQGYLNLLPSSQKTSRDPGDSKAMVEARRLVLDTGLFDPFAKELSRQVSSRMVHQIERPAVVLDAGCGEGYYTDYMRRSVSVAADRMLPVFVGVDISKWGILAAARRYPDVTWVVGNNKRLPVLSGSVDIITSVFGFETWQPWAALQSPGQNVLVAHAGPLHLIEMRELIYEEVTIHEAADDKAAIEAGYQRIDASALNFQAQLDSLESAERILSMTPHGYRIPTDKRAGLAAALSGLLNKPLTIDVLFRWYQRC